MESFDRKILTNCWKFVKFVNIFLVITQSPEAELRTSVNN